MLTLIIGGARSGKSSRALTIAREFRNVLFVATAEPLDSEMASRIARHRDERPRHWVTLEVARNLGESLRAESLVSYDCVVIDCLTLWVSNLLLAAPSREELEWDVLAHARLLVDAYAAGRADWIIVTNEVGLGIVPDAELGRVYRDLLGCVNALIAEKADRVLFTVAGLAIDMKAFGKMIPTWP